MKENLLGNQNKNKKQHLEEGKLKESFVEELYQELSEETSQTLEAFHFHNFELRDGELYYRNKRTPLTNKWNKLRSFHAIAHMLGKEGLCDLGFDIPTGKVMARQAIMLNRVEEELPSMSDLV